MGTTTVSIEERVSAFLSDFTKLEAVEEAFNLFLVHRSDLDQANFETAASEWVSILKEISGLSGEAGGAATQQDVALRLFVQSMVNQRNEVTQEKMRKLLERAVEEKVVSARQVCDVVMSPSNFKFENTIFWSQSLSLVGKIISGVDYKGVREIMKLCIDKIASIPPDVEVSQLESIQGLLDHIFDRKAALLPGYFIVNEILKSYPENKSWPHWSLVNMIDKFLNSFKPTAQMVTCFNRDRMRPVVEPASGKSCTSWKLDPASLKFLLKGSMTYERILPYGREVVEPQSELLLYVLSQPGFKDFISNMLGLQKPRKDANVPAVRYPSLEEQVVRYFFQLMSSNDAMSTEQAQNLWRTSGCVLIFLTTYQYVSFAGFVENLWQKIKSEGFRPSLSARDNLMWALLQLISGSLSKSYAAGISGILKILELYDEPDARSVPTPTDLTCVQQLSAAAIFTIMSSKAKQEGCNLRHSMPKALKLHCEYLNSLASQDIDYKKAIESGDLTPALFFNTYSTDAESFHQPLTVFAKLIGATLEPDQTVPMPGPNGAVAASPAEPLSMEFLDSLSVHVKMSIIHSIGTFLTKQISIKPNVSLSPGLVETFCRLFVYPEIEGLGVKNILQNILPTIFKQNNWEALNVFLDVFSYRLHHVQAQYRITLLHHIQVGLTNAQNMPPMVAVNVESTKLRLITSFGNSDFSPQKGATGQQKPIIYTDSEELNRVIVLALARTIQISGVEQQSASWIKEIVSNIMQKTPQSWPSHTLQNFPPILAEFFQENPGPKENKAQLKQKVEEEYNVWMTMTNEAELIKHFKSPSNSFFLCVLWKLLLEAETIPDKAYKVLEGMSLKQLTVHIRSFCDVLIGDFSKSGGTGYVGKYIEAMNILIWKYNIVPLDQLVLCMVLRNNEGNEAHVCYFIVQLLLLKPPDFRDRVNELVHSLPPEHQVGGKFHENHLSFHQSFPESFLGPSSGSTPSVPSYFGNVCLRFLPVLDIVVHRFLELPPVTKSLETLIDHLGPLYKFHMKPITYLYNTLHYYELLLRNRSSLRKKLIYSIAGSLTDVRPVGWCLTQDFIDYLVLSGEEAQNGWTPVSDYYFRLVGRLTEAVQGRHPFPPMDWRFNEFPNECSHALHVTCVEIMGLPFEPLLIVQQLLNVVLQRHYMIPAEEVPDWINSIGLIIVNLPVAFWDGMNQILAKLLTSSQLSQWNSNTSPFEVFRYKDNAKNNELTLMLCLAHSVFHHAGFSQIQTLPDLVREKFLPVMKTEEQLLFVFHLTGPFLQRLHSERYMRPLFDLTVQFYRMLQKVDKECKDLKYKDSICDILYHVKYQFTGDSVKQDAERIVRELSGPLQLRLRFIAPGIAQSQ